MATILSLALKVNADASGVVKNLTPAERALEKLAGQASKATSVFDEFAGTSAAAANAQFSASQSMAELAESLKKGEITAQQFAARYAELTDEINKEAAAFKRAADITKANISPLERYDSIVAELDDQLRAGRISQETYNRALEKAKTDLDRAGTSAKQTDKSLESLANNTRILAGIEIGRLFIDGLQSLGNVFRDITNRVTSLVSSVNGSIDTLNDFSARTGIGVEALQGYSLAAKLAGIDTEQFGSAIQRLAVNIGKATPGDALDKSLRAINLSLQELRGLSPEDQFSAIGQAISQLPTAADRAAAAVEIFGKQGAALAPLFREGAASLEELQAKAERLGIIVSETQVNNVAEMNDAFDLVRATIEGIIGQVIGNLAPAVTDVTNQFLQFVESWSGAQGEGGTGIANAITDVLLQGAEYFAAVFDEFVSGLTGLGVSFEDTSATFTASANAFTFVSEGLRTVANVFEIAGNALAAALGKIIETLGSFVSSDLEEYGRELTRQAMIATEENSRQLEDAAANAGRAFVGIFAADGGTAENSGKGAAESYLSGLRDEIRRQRSPEVKVQASLGDAQERLDAYFRTAEDGGSVFFQQSAETVAKFQEMAAAGGLTADQIAIMNGFMDDLNGKLDQEIAQRQQAAEAAAAQADADKKRIDSLLQSNDAAAKIEQDLQAVQREQARVSEELAAAREADNVAQADAAAARQGELDQLQAKLEEQQQALEQGFGQGFDAAFQNVNENINGLVDKSAEFGQAGFDAAVRLQEGIAAAQQQARDGILNAEAFNQEVQRQQELFNQELANIDEAEKARAKAADDRAKAEDDRQKALLKAQDDYRKQQETALQAYQQQQVKAQEEYAKEQQRIFEEQRKAAEAEAKRQEERLAKLNTLGAQSLSVADVRSTEGANLVLQLAAGAQDPRLIQERLQTKLLQVIANGITQAADNYFNTPVGIVGGSMTLNPNAQQNVRL
jgi:hypothetical protein